MSSIRRDWSRKQFDAFWDNTPRVEPPSCVVDGCEGKPFAQFDDGFAHIFTYCHAHAEDTIRSGHSGADEPSRWKLVQ
jgi:hypothetical protein